MQRYKWMPLEYDPQRPDDRPRIGWAGPTLDMHGNPLIPSRLVRATDPAAKVVITAGEVFDPSDPWFEKFCRATPAFKKVA
jgi:hypothetical protein